MIHTGVPHVDFEKRVLSLQPQRVSNQKGDREKGVSALVS
jgi:hypothetical protein